MRRPVERGELEKARILPFAAGMILFMTVFSGAAYFFAAVLPGLWSLKDVPAAAGEPKYIVVDPGHGGEDGGCVSEGVLEKDLNLAVSENILDLAAFLGIPAKATRRDDTLLHDLYGDFPDGGKKKQYDLKNRVRFAREENAAVYLGVHMNKFPSEKYSGLQVFYSPNTEIGAVLAGEIQSAVRENLQPQNDREIKKATSAVFVLSKCEMPAVLCECGFLSNGEERELLCDEGYRAKLALCIFAPTAELFKTLD